MSFINGGIELSSMSAGIVTTYLVRQIKEIFNGKPIHNIASLYLWLYRERKGTKMENLASLQKFH